MTLVIGLCCEDHGHFRTATCLVDRTLAEELGLDDATVAHRRTWAGYDPGPWSKYSPDHARRLRPARRHGHIGGRPQEPEAAMWRNVLLLFVDAKPRPDVVILARDLDGEPRRLRGFHQVRDHLPWPFPVLLAAAEPEVEGWVVCGFEPADPTETQALLAVRRDLGFDPRLESHRLTSHPNAAKTDAKRVLARLLGDAQWDTCLRDRVRLRERGAANGLAEFLAQIDQHIVPLFAVSS